ncbi:hypothetical protein OCE55_05190 [Bacillus paranthracis]|uniref:hypothetical protein n=1 Tax=Bacillus cereus group TaxID=86661 RepID=UPI001F592688|nr:MULTISPECIES: hypothetical protein [Bacillus cereus group]MCU5387429.1 hypothetical protein [Bacillus paranthracis]
MGEVTSAEIIGEARGGATVKIRAVIDGKPYEGEMRKETREMLQPFFREHKEEIMKKIERVNKQNKHALWRFREEEGNR